MSAPFNLTWGSSIVVRIVASNQYGDSVTSTTGSGAVIITYAAAPFNITEIVSLRTNTSITLTW